MLEVIGSTLTPFLWGGAMALVLNIPLGLAERKLQKLPLRARRTVGLTIVLAGFGAAAALGLWLLVPQLITAVTDLTRSLPSITEEIQAMPGEKEWGGILEKLSSAEEGGMEHILQICMQTAGRAAGQLGRFILSLILAVYFLSAKESLCSGAKMICRALFGAKYADALGHLAGRAMTVFSGFVAGQCVEACILAGLFVLTLLVFRMPYVLPISAVIGVTALVPVFGAWIGCTVGVLLILPTGVEKTAIFAILFLVVQQLENNLIYPRVVGSRIDLPPAWVLAAVILGGGLFGVAGLILGIPAMSVLYHVGGEWIKNRNEKEQMRPDGLDMK